MDRSKMFRKEYLTLIKYDWKQQDATRKEIRRLLIKEVYPTLTDDAIMDCFHDGRVELEQDYDELNELQERFANSSGEEQ